MNVRAFRLGVVMVAACSAVTVALRAFAEAAFLSAYGARQLPWLLIANAIGFAAATLGYDALTRHARAQTVDLVLLTGLVVAAAAAPGLLHAGLPPIVLVIVLTAVSQVSGLALWNRVAASVAGRDARRVLPRAGAAITTGGAIAGLSAGAVIPRLGLAAIPYTAAVIAAGVVAVYIAQQRALGTGGAPGTIAPPTPARNSGLVARRLLVALAAVAVLEGIVATVVDLQFITALKARYTGNDLGAALALFYGATNVILLGLQATAAPHLLVTRSMTFLAAIHPVVVIAAYIWFAISPSFIAIAGTRTCDQVLRLATSRPAQELALSTVPPAPRARYKVLLRGAMWPTGAAAAAFALLLLGPAAVAHPVRLAGAAIAVALAAAVLARIAARRFQTALAAPLGIPTANRTAADRAAQDPRRIDLETLQRWTLATAAADPRHAALARAALARARIAPTDLADHLRDDEPAVRAALFTQLTRTPAPELRGELRAAIAIEDDDDALAAGIHALARLGDRAGIDRGRARAGLSRTVDDAVAAAEAIVGDGDLEPQLAALVERDATLAIALVRARRPAPELVERLVAATLAEQLVGEPRRIPEAARSSPADAALVGGPRVHSVRDVPETGRSHAVDEVLVPAPRRVHALALAAAVASPGLVATLSVALAAGDPAALAALESIDDDAARTLAAHVTAFDVLAKVATARAAANAPTGVHLISALLSDRDPEVAHAALRSAVALARGGTQSPAGHVAVAHGYALAALGAYLDARDAFAAAAPMDTHATDSARSEHATDSARAELALATRRCVARLLWASALDAAAAGRDPALLAATARHLVGAGEAERKRALDVTQELQAHPDVIAAIERWLGGPVAPREPSDHASARARALDALAVHDRWLAALLAHDPHESQDRRDRQGLLAILRGVALFAPVAGPALAALAARVETLDVDGLLFGAGDAGDAMFVIAAGAVVAQRDGEVERRIVPGEVVGELALLTRAPRATSARAAEPGTRVLAIDRVAFGEAARRAPEIVLGLSATLAGWLAPHRHDRL